MSPPQAGSSERRWPFADCRRQRGAVAALKPESHIAFIEQWIDDGCPDQDDASTFTWSRTGDQASSRHGDVWFLPRDLGWAVNSDDKIPRTADGGIAGAAISYQRSLPALRQIRIGGLLYWVNGNGNQFT
jgi:hypothetical protein